MLDGEAHLKDYLRVLRKHRWLITGIFLVTVIAGALWTFVQTPIYEASATVQIEPEPPKVLNIQEVTTIGSSAIEYYRTQYALIQSTPVIQNALDALAKRERAAARAALGGPSDARRTPRGTLTVEPIRNTQLVLVKFDHPDPAVAAEVATAVAQAYVRYNLDVKLKSTREALAWLNEQMAGLRAKVQQSSEALQNYRVKAGMLGLQEQRALTAQKIADSTRAHQEAQAQRLSVEAKLREVSRIVKDKAGADTISSVIDDPLIRRIKTELADLQVQRSKALQTYKEKHPEVLKIDAQIQQLTQRLEVELQKTLRTLETEYKVAQARESNLLAAVNALRREGQEVNEKEIPYLALQRENESNQQLYEAVLKRVKETGVAGGIDANNVRVVEEAQAPSSPISPRKTLNLVLSLLVGIVAGVGVAVAIEYFDTSLKSPDDVQRVLGLPVLSIVPAFEERR
ncbi:MAG TPA: GumC family protein [Methylomirabilota bacterium]|nr:GumC family protein [Methylomirabilota bacterium]